MTSISIITPSFNQGRFIERTIQSVITQDWENLEYLIMDGGSTDETCDILKKYSNRLIWQSERDNGQAHAVNKGLKLAKGDIIGWLNSDDIYYPNAIKKVMKIFSDQPQIDIIYGDAYHIDENDHVINKYYTEAWSYKKLKEVCFLSQPAVFFRKHIINHVGLLNETLHYCMDYEYWLRLASRGFHFYYLPEILAGSRLYAENKTLGSTVKVHYEINDMFCSLYNIVPDRWLSNYAHVLVRSNTSELPKSKFQRKIALQTILASLRWNKKISLSLLAMTSKWMVSSFCK